jgi:hypothetical protein
MFECLQVKDLTMDGRETHSVFQLVKDNTLVEYQVRDMYGQREGRWAICEGTGSYLLLVLLGRGWKEYRNSNGEGKSNEGGAWAGVHPTLSKLGRKYHHPLKTRAALCVISSLCFMTFRGSFGRTLFS